MLQCNAQAALGKGHHEFLFRILDSMRREVALRIVSTAYSTPSADWASKGPACYAPRPLHELWGLVVELQRVICCFIMSQVEFDVCEL